MRMLVLVCPNGRTCRLHIRVAAMLTVLTCFFVLRKSLSLLPLQNQTRDWRIGRSSVCGSLVSSSTAPKTCCTRGSMT